MNSINLEILDEKDALHLIRETAFRGNEMVRFQIAEIAFDGIAPLAEISEPLFEAEQDEVDLNVALVQMRKSCWPDMAAGQKLVIFYREEDFIPNDWSKAPYPVWAPYAVARGTSAILDLNMAHRLHQMPKPASTPVWF